jgi:hypothetical protein
MNTHTASPVNPTTPVFEGFTEPELRAAFEAVQAPNWKDPISAYVADEFRPVVRAAIIFFAGCEPTFTAYGTGHLKVEAEGYYAAVGA